MSFCERILRSSLPTTLIVVVIALQIKPWWSPKEDSVGYLSIARNLAAGRLENLGEPNLHFAPGYPLLLAPLTAADDRPFLAISALHASALGALFLGLRRLMRRLEPTFGDGLAALVLVHVAVGSHARTVLSETTFMAALVWTAELGRGLLSKQDGAGRARWVGCALALFGLALIRQAGALLGLVLAALLLLRGRRDPAGGFGGIAGPLLLAASGSVAAGGWALVDLELSRAGGDGSLPSYLELARDPALGLPGQALETFRLRISEVGRLLWPGCYKVYAPRGVWLHPAMAVHLAACAVVAAGWARLRRRSGREPMVLLLPAWFLLHLAWPWDQGARFMLPLLPTLLAAAFALVPGPERRRAAVLALAILAHLVPSLLSLGAEADHRRLDRHWPEIEAVAAAIGEDRDRVASRGLRNPRRMLEVAIDRRTLRLGDGKAPPAAVLWIVVGADEELPRGFEAVRSGELVLLGRRRR